MWLRLIGSTFVGQLADTVIFAFVAFGGILTGMDMVTLIGIGWIFKTGVEVVMLPLTYPAINFLNRREGVDAYDKQTNFSPAH